MIKSFKYAGLAHRVLFGAGSVQQLGAELSTAGILRPLLLCSRGARRRTEAVIRSTGVELADTFDRVRMHVPRETARAAQQAYAGSSADGAIAFGGGSATGLAKILARDGGHPYVVVPTTYSGSEMTPIWGLTTDGEKQTGRDLSVLPRAVIYDPVLTLGLPVAIAAASGLNAMAHSVEALYAENANPVTNAIAEQSIRLLGAALPEIVADPANLAARSDALQGAWLAGLALASVGMALHHKLCHVLGGTYDLDHALTHSVVLPHALNYNRQAAPDALTVVGRALGHENGPAGLFELARRLGLPAGLKDLGLPASDLDEAALLAAKSPYYNPAPITREGIRGLLEDAWQGRVPG